MIVYNAALARFKQALVQSYLNDKWTNTITSTISTPFNVISVPPTQLTYSNAPVSTNAGFVVGSSGGIVVQMLDANGVPATNSAGTTSPVSLTSGSGTLLGTLTRATAANGQATFTNLSITLVDTYTLQAGRRDLTPTSDPIAADQSRRGGQAGLCAATGRRPGGQLSFFPYPTVEIQDAYGNVRVDNGTNVTLRSAPGTSLFLQNDVSHRRSWAPPRRTASLSLTI